MRTVSEYTQIIILFLGKKTTESKTERAPAFSFGARPNGKLESIGPGPGQYNVTGLSAKGEFTDISSNEYLK